MEYVCLDGRIILKCISKYWCLKCGLRTRGWRYGPVANSVRGQKRRGMFWPPNDCLLLKKDPAAWSVTVSSCPCSRPALLTAGSVPLLPLFQDTDLYTCCESPWAFRLVLELELVCRNLCMYLCFILLRLRHSRFHFFLIYCSAEYEMVG